MSDDLVRKRSRRVLRLGLLLVVVGLIVAIGLLFPWSRDAIGIEAAEELLQLFKERGESYSHVTSILGPPTESLPPQRSGDTHQLCMWNYPREGFLESEITQFVTAFESGKLYYVKKQKYVMSGSELWKLRWARLKNRLSLGK